MSFILEDRTSSFNDMHQGLWKVLNKITLKTATFDPISYEEVFDTVSSFQFTHNLLELMYNWPEAQPNQTSRASRITSVENFKYNFERWRYIKEYNQLLGARWLIQTDIRQVKQFFRGNISSDMFEETMKGIQVISFDQEYALGGSELKY